MKSVSLAPEDSLHIIAVFGDLVVAGYFEQGVWHDVTFTKYLQICVESNTPPEYLKPVKGFSGIRFIVPAKDKGEFLATLAIPVFNGGRP